MFSRCVLCDSLLMCWVVCMSTLCSRAKVFLLCSSQLRLLLFFFFFQAEDGIRDGRVTGVQTCALPILTERETPPVDGLVIGILGGTGEQGRGLARRFAMAGNPVIIGSRSHDRAHGVARDRKSVV